MTCRIWSRSRSRRGAGKLRTLLSTGGVSVFLGGVRTSAGNVVSLVVVPAAGIAATRAENAASTWRASAPDNWFFVANRRCAHSAASGGAEGLNFAEQLGR